MVWEEDRNDTTKTTYARPKEEITVGHKCLVVCSLLLLVISRPTAAARRLITEKKNTARNQDKDFASSSVNRDLIDNELASHILYLASVPLLILCPILRLQVKRAKDGHEGLTSQWRRDEKEEVISLKFHWQMSFS